MKNSEQVVEIVVQVKLRDGRRAEAVFVRKTKIAEILGSGDAFGSFVRDLSDSIPENSCAVAANKNKECTSSTGAPASIVAPFVGTAIGGVCGALLGGGMGAAFGIVVGGFVGVVVACREPKP